MRRFSWGLGTGNVPVQRREEIANELRDLLMDEIYSVVNVKEQPDRVNLMLKRSTFDTIYFTTPVC